MTDEDIEKLIEDMAEEYADDEKEYVYINGDDMIMNYDDLKQGFIDGFKAGMKFKEKELT